jgi:hypothetical protein
MGTTLSTDDPILAANFAKLKTFNDVAILLEVTTSKLGFYLHRSNNYKVFSLRKRSGGHSMTRSVWKPLGIAPTTEVGHAPDSVSQMG